MNNIEKFLKRDNRKIILVVIFLILHLVFSSSSIFSFCAVNFAGFSCGYLALLGILSLPIDLLVIEVIMDFWGGYGYWGLTEFFLFSIVVFFYFYLISYIIIWIYDKVRKGRKK